MKSGPLVSVIIPCYNVAGYVEKAIKSILQQTYKKLELLIINDASTDDTLQRIQKLTDARIRVIDFKENTKKIGAVNVVLKQANGELIAFQDADDWSEPERIGEQVKQFEANSSLGICFTKYRFVGYTTNVPERIAITDPELKDEFLEFGHKKNTSFQPTNCPSMMITREVLNKTGGYHPYFIGRVAEDIHWIYRILKDFEGITVDKILYNYLVREGSLTQRQLAGENAKAAYTWQLLSKIICKDVHEGIDVLAARNEAELSKLELQACEEALVEQIRAAGYIKQSYQNSSNFKIGKAILAPFRILTAVTKVLHK